MIFRALEIDGAFALIPERHEDERGHFARTFCVEEFAAHALDTRIAQSSSSFNRVAGTLRGMHYQVSPHQETKLVRCTRGAIFDVIIDLRQESPTFLRWQALELTADNGRAVYIPPGLAHGFQTLVDDCEVLYQMSTMYEPRAARGVRWDDPAFAIQWPTCEHRTISERDRSHPPFRALGAARE